MSDDSLNENDKKLLEDAQVKIEWKDRSYNDSSSSGIFSKFGGILGSIKDRINGLYIAINMWLKKKG